MKGIKLWFTGIRVRLVRMNAWALVVTIVSGVIAMNGLRTLSHLLEKSVQEDVPRVLALGEMSARIEGAVLSLWNAHASFGKPDAQKAALAAYRQSVADFDAAFDGYQKLPGHDQKAIDRIKSLWPELKRQTLEASVLIERPALSDHEAARETLSERIREVQGQLDGAFRGMNQAALESMRVEQLAADKFEVRMQLWTLVTAIIGTLVLALLGFGTAAALAGNLTRASERLAGSVTQVSGASTSIAGAAEQLSQATTQQATSLEETASSVEQMSSMIQKNSDHARKTAELAEASKKSVEAGKHAVQEMALAISEINSGNNEIMAQVAESNRNIAEIVKVIGEIGSKTKVINEIVFQTKLLSFNASVEAARAGEHGKGFAVVAEEVGNLAQMSGASAKEISELLDQSIGRVQSIADDTKEKVEKLVLEAKTKIDVGIETVKSCENAFNQIVASVATVNAMAKEISSASHEQSRGAQEITKAINQLDQVTQQNSASAEETSTSADSLSRQVSALRGMIHDLAVIIDGRLAGADSREDDGIDVAGAGYTGADRPSARREVLAGGAKILRLRRAGDTVQLARERPVRAASGGGFVPSEDDPRFRDV